MKHLLSILLICSIGFTQELTVDGNLNVTGTIESQTIDSLMQVIAGLEAQIALMQDADNKLETRIYSFPFNPIGGEVIPINMLEITGHDLSVAIIHLLSINNNNETTITIDYGCDSISGQTFFTLSNNKIGITSYRIYHSNENCYLQNLSSNNFTSNLTILVTAQFPD